MNTLRDDRHPLRLCMPNGSPLSSSLARWRRALRPASLAPAQPSGADRSGGDELPAGDSPSRPSAARRR
jgi:hypothetical protein